MLIHRLAGGLLASVLLAGCGTTPQPSSKDVDGVFATINAGLSGDTGTIEYSAAYAADDAANKPTKRTATISYIIPDGTVKHIEPQVPWTLEAAILPGHRAYVSVQATGSDVTCMIRQGFKVLVQKTAQDTATCEYVLSML